jgi:hypothetical protein
MLILSYRGTREVSPRIWVFNTVQTDPAKNVWTRAYLIPERNRTGRRQEEGKNSVYLFVLCASDIRLRTMFTENGYIF